MNSIHVKPLTAMIQYNTPMKKITPVTNDNRKADLRVLPLMTINKGTKANQARNSRSNFGKDSINKKAENKARTAPFVFTFIVAKALLDLSASPSRNRQQSNDSQKHL